MVTWITRKIKAITSIRAVDSQLKETQIGFKISKIIIHSTISKIEMRN